MKASLKKKWLGALRSGKYEQGTGYLKCHSKFCCLGVLCDLSELASWEKHESDDGVFLFTDDEFELSSCLLKEFGLSAGQQRKLVNMNDGSYEDKRHSFPEIADWIEANVPEETK